MTSRVMAIRGLAGGDASDDEGTTRQKWSGRGVLKGVAWLAALGAGGFLVRRVVRRRRRIDLGQVSDDWVARYRTPPDPFTL
jgi:hypothetical protein